MTALLRSLIDALDILIKPVSEPSFILAQGRKENTLEKMLQFNLSILGETIQSNPRYKDLYNLRETIKGKTDWFMESDDATWMFVLENLLILTCLKECMMDLLNSFVPPEPNQRTSEAAPPLPPDVLSISQQKTVHAAVQFVISLGICPFLLPGVGVPLHCRSQFGAEVTNATTHVTHSSGTHRLLITCRVLLDIADHPSLGSMVMTRNLGDILAALCQLGYCPNRKKEDEHVSDQKSQTLNLEERSECRKALQRLLSQVYQPLIVQELLILQGGGKQVRLSRNSDSKQLRAPAPPWLRRLCGQLLSERLIQTNGMQAVVRGILEGAGAGAVGGKDAEAAAADWRKCDSVARILAACPQQSLSVDDYYKHVCPQVLDMLHIRDKLTALQFQRVATATIVTMTQEQPELAERYLLKPMVMPLLRCQISGGCNQNIDTVIAEECELTICIEDIYKVCVVGNNPTAALLDSLGSVIQIIFLLYCFSMKNACHLRSTCEEIMTWYFQKTKRPKVISVLKQLSGLNVKTDSLLPGYIFVPGSDGGAVCTVKEPICDEDDDLYEKVSSEQWRIECFVDLLAVQQDSDLAGDFFIEILKGLTTLIVDNTEEPTNISSLNLLEVEQYQNQQVRKQEEKLITLQLLAVMCEKLSHSVFQNPLQVIEFVGAMLQRACTSLRYGLDNMVQSQTISMGMGLLSAMLAGAAKLKSEDYTALKHILPLLQEMSDHHPEVIIQELASDLRITIATHGAFTPETVTHAAHRTMCQDDTKAEKHSEQASSQNTVAPPDANVEKGRKCTRNENHELKNEETITFIDRNRKGQEHLKEQTAIKESSFPDIQSKINQDIPINLVGTNCNNDQSKDHGNCEDGKLVSECILEAVHPDIPTRATALRQLTQMIKSKNAEAVNCEEKILLVFLENLEHEDSFVYLSAIQGLAVLADMFPKIILQKLLDEYQKCTQDSRKACPLETKLKIAEVLMRSTRALGELTPHYGGALIHAFLRGTRDEDSTVRASSLSNIGELCQRLGFTLGSLVHELNSCVTAIIKTDTEAEVRRAAVHVIGLLLRGLSEKTTQILHEVLRDFYHLLKYVVHHDPDDVAVLHGQLALEELDEIMRRYLFPEQKLEKKIVVLP
ncbi:transport and Golgi organization protein 6 homolog [Polypterus senegalus]|uniref:transport and Golgi organization protein 6 homolog n=1 Tax=Polypterus senegalus TaxID=55291 RepID=UPI0019645651|nr:transport and Golgi organization protein 6 homolog [Polypterus senegalus]